MEKLEFKVGDIIVQMGCRTRRMVLDVLNGEYGISHPLRGDSDRDAIMAFDVGIAGICDREIEKIYVKVGHWCPELLEYTDEN